MDISSVTRPERISSRWRMRSIERSRIVTCAPRPMRDDAPRCSRRCRRRCTTTRPGATPGTPPSSSPRPPSGFSRKYAPACAASRPATSLIGASSGSAPVVGLDGLVRDGGDAALDERPRQRLVGRDVQVGEEHEPLAERGVLGLDRLLHLEQQLGRLPRPRRRTTIRAPTARVRLVGERAAGAGAGLDHHLVAALARARARRPASARRGTRPA